jgi:hypothetical protein
MGQGKAATFGILLVLTCSEFCRRQFYESGFQGSLKEECVCCESLKKSTPYPMEINLEWYRRPVQSEPYEDDYSYWEYLKRE